MSNLMQQITDRIERLLLRHEELQKTNQLLAQQVTQLTQERDALKGRLQTARQRIDALLERWRAVCNRPLRASRDRKSTRLNSSHIPLSRMPSSA